MTENKSPAPQFIIPEWLTPHVEEVAGWRAVATPEIVCRVLVCDRTIWSLGLCYQHYSRQARRRARRAGVATVEWLREHESEVDGWPAIRSPKRLCWVINCDRSATTHGLCVAHLRLAWHHFRRAGEVRSPVVALRRDSETASPKTPENTSNSGLGESTREPREVAGDPTECAS